MSSPCQTAAATTTTTTTTTPAGGGGGSAAVDDPYASITYMEALEDVHTRFVLNLPDSELQTADRIFFQLEQAWWFYEDWICDPRPQLDLPRYANFRPFARMLFEYSPVLPGIEQFDTMWNAYSQYKRKISNYGCILMNTDMNKFVLCRVWNGKTHTFPAGKINQGERGRDAAARETYEETGFDPLCRCGITAEWKEKCPEKITWDVNFGEADKLVNQEENVDGGNQSGGGGGGKRRTVYVITGVPEDFPFEPVCRKEVSEIAWYPMDNVPKPSYAVIPFLHPLKKYIHKKKKMGAATTSSSSTSTRKKTPSKRNGSRGRSSRGRPGSRGRNDSRGRGGIVQSDDDDLVTSGLASAGDVSGWSEEDMFLANERLIGRKVEYDGNPHVFVEEGLSQGDPHAFRVVGGSFLNSDGGVESLAPPPERSRLQPLFRKQDKNHDEDENNNDDNDLKGLTPFFSDDGATPWGEVVADAVSDDCDAKQTNKRKQKKKKKNQSQQESASNTNIPDEMNEEISDLFLTDRQITQKSQASKTRAVELFPSNNNNDNNYWNEQYERDMEYIRQWVARLPKPVATKHFGVFKLDADAILAQAERDVPALRPPLKSP